jgi:hypothetical protein
MSKTTKRILTLAALFLILFAAATIVSTVGQLANSADRVLAGSGQYVFFGLLGLFVTLAVTPIVLFLRLPKFVAPPTTTQGPEYESYQAWLLGQLKVNPHLTGTPVHSEQDITTAMQILHRKADDVIKDAASAIFVSTSVMQNGKLDGLMMLVTQGRLVWQVAAIFQLRPSPRQLMYLYSNVGSAMLIAGNIDDVDFAEIVTPIVTSVAPSMVGAVPGFQGVAALLTNSLASGAANAFLTLRVGMLAKAYCSPVAGIDQSTIRRGASAQAMALIGTIVKTNGTKIMKAAWSSFANPLAGAAEVVGNSVKSATSKASAMAGSAAESVGDALGTTARQIKVGASSISTAASGVGQGIGRAAEAGAGHIKLGSAAVVDATEGAAKAIGRTAGAGIQHVKGGVTSVVETSKELGVSIVQASAVASDKAVGLGKAIGRAADASAKVTANAASKVAEKSSAVFSRKV